MGALGGEHRAAPRATGADGAKLPRAAHREPLGCLGTFQLLSCGVARGAVWAFGLGLLAASTAAGAEPAPVWVWYRTSEGCPDGEAFVSRLAELGKAARLARVGDRVDFVVTLGSDSHESSGRLERQTRAGIVAIREYRDARCEQVAEALALTLDLTLEPDAPSTTGSPASALGAGEASRKPAVIALGAQGTLVTGIAPGVVPGAALFVAGHPGSAWLASWRGTLLGAYRESTALEREIHVLVLGGRIEGCPIEARVDLLSFSPCLGLDAGLLRATGPDALGIADAGFWSSIVAHGRVAVRLGDGLSLELQAGAQLPLVRFEMGTEDGSAAWFRTRLVGLAAGFGAAWQIP